MVQTVLIVDDSLTVRMDLADAFEAAGFRTCVCATLAAARAELERAPIRVVVLDVVLPDGDGVDLLTDIRSSTAGPPSVVMMLSSEAEVKDRIRALSIGADDYVGKPYDKGYVVSKARELLRLRFGAADGSGTTVLIVDDSVTYREELRAAFERAGYSVLVAASGEAGLRIAADRRPSAIVVDSVMPGIDGSTFIRRLRLDAVLRGTPSLLLTASEDRSAELRALDAGADAFVRKEEEVDVVLARLAAVLRRPMFASANDTGSLTGARKILAVDGSPTYLAELGDVLREEGYDVIQARSGEEALELLAVQSVDCVLIDPAMPGLGGTETCRRIKAAPTVRDIPLIMLAAREDRDAMLEALSAGADDYISKSSELDVIKARVRAQIRRKQFEDENRRIRDDLLQKELEAAEARAARQLAETKAAMAEELQRKNDELEAFSYSVAHDLRAPVRRIDGFCQALIEDCGAKLDDVGLDHLRQVRDAAERMQQLIDDLFALSRVSGGELQRDRAYLSEMAKAVTDDLRRREPEHMVSVKIREDVVCAGDRGLLRVLLDNLLGNAWKFTSKTEAAQVEFDIDTRDGETVYLVRDNGAGFDMALARKLFIPFQRLHRQADFPGTGVGLATVRRIVERHGGRIWAESAVGRGATFFFSLPGAGAQ